jgi:hypothetical protein
MLAVAVSSTPSAAFATDLTERFRQRSRTDKLARPQHPSCGQARRPLDRAHAPAPAAGSTPTRVAWTVSGGLPTICKRRLCRMMRFKETAESCISARLRFALGAAKVIQALQRSRFS